MLLAPRRPAGERESLAERNYTGGESVTQSRRPEFSQRTNRLVRKCRRIVGRHITRHTPPRFRLRSPPRGSPCNGFFSMLLHFPHIIFSQRHNETLFRVFKEFFYPFAVNGALEGWMPHSSEHKCVGFTLNVLRKSFSNSLHFFITYLSLFDVLMSARRFGCFAPNSNLSFMIMAR